MKKELKFCSESDSGNCSVNSYKLSIVKYISLFSYLLLIFNLTTNNAFSQDNFKEEMDRYIKKINKYYYYPQKHGLTDIKADLKITMQGNSKKSKLYKKFDSPIKLKFYWKAPHKFLLKYSKKEKLKGGKKKLVSYLQGLIRYKMFIQDKFSRKNWVDYVKLMKNKVVLGGTPNSGESNYYNEIVFNNSFKPIMEKTGNTELIANYKTKTINGEFLVVGYQSSTNKEKVKGNKEEPNVKIDMDANKLSISENKSVYISKSTILKQNINNNNKKYTEVIKMNLKNIKSNIGLTDEIFD